MQIFVFTFLELFQESAPWLILGLLIAGMMKWLVPIELLNKHMGKDDFRSIVKAAFIGAPLPLCSCGVIPAAIGLRRAGASKPATVSFLVATPETGVDSISVSYALLGPFMAVIRPIAAIMSAIYVGLLTMLFANKNKTKAATKATSQVNSDEKLTSSIKSSCCEQSNTQAKPKTVEKSCCSKTDELVQVREKSAKSLLIDKLINVLSYASGKLLSDITKWLMMGLLLAAAVKTWIPSDFLTQHGDGLTAMLVMALVGIPMYICATASTPIAVGFLAVGVSPGAVLVFMLAGPATNLSTMGMIREEMGNSVLVSYLVGILSASIGFGYLTNWAVNSFSIEIYQAAGSSHQMDVSIIHSLSAVLLALLMLKNFIKAYK